MTQRPASKHPQITPAAGKPANANAMYQQLRTVAPSGEVAAANNLVLKRDAGTFTFRTGNFCLMGR